MVAKKSLKVNVIGCPIYREANELAMSSRNERLSAQDEASIIYKILSSVKEQFSKK
jgi:pantoate--beta-alanine ligase